MTCDAQAKLQNHLLIVSVSLQYICHREVSYVKSVPSSCLCIFLGYGITRKEMKADFSVESGNTNKKNAN